MYGEKDSILQVKPIEQVDISLVIDIYIKSNQREGETMKWLLAVTVGVGKYKQRELRKLQGQGKCRSP